MPDHATSNFHQLHGQLDLQVWLQVKLCGIRLLVEGEEVDVAVVVVAAAGSAALAGSGLPLLQPLPVLLSQEHSTVPDLLWVA